MESKNVNKEKRRVNPRGPAYEVIVIEWQQETLITNSNLYLLGVCGDVDTDILNFLKNISSKLGTF